MSGTDELTPETVQALLDGAAPGPWRYRPHPHDDWGWVRGPDDRLVARASGPDQVGGGDPHEGTGRLIAAARDLGDRVLALEKRAAALSAELDRTRAQAGALKDAAQRFGDAFDAADWWDGVPDTVSGARQALFLVLMEAGADTEDERHGEVGG